MEILNYSLILFGLVILVIINFTDSSQKDKKEMTTVTNKDKKTNIFRTLTVQR